MGMPPLLGADARMDTTRRPPQRNMPLAAMKNTTHGLRMSRTVRKIPDQNCAHGRQDIAHRHRMIHVLFFIDSNRRPCLSFRTTMQDDFDYVGPMRRVTWAPAETVQEITTTELEMRERKTLARAIKAGASLFHLYGLFLLFFIHIASIIASIILSPLFVSFSVGSFASF